MNHWKIKTISYCYLLVLIGCGGKEPERQDNRKPVGITAQEMTTEWNKMIRSVTKQFAGKLNEVSGQVLSEFKTQADATLKRLEEREETQTGLFKEDLTKKLNGMIQSAAEQFTGKLNEVSGQVLSEFKIQADAILKGMGDREATQVHLAVENVTKELNGAIQTAATQLSTELTKVLSTAGDNVITEIDKATQTATTDVTASIDAAANRFKTSLTDQIQGPATAPKPEPEPLDPVTKIIEEARPAIRNIVRNSEVFLDFAVEEIVQQAMETLNIQWAEITTEEDKKKLIDQVMDAFHNSERKYEVKNVHSALMLNIRQTTQNIPIGIVEMVGLKETEKTKVTNEIHSETEKAIKEFIDERMRHAVGRAIDAETAEEAVYTLQFDIRNTLLHRDFGKPINLFISLKKNEESEGFSLSRRGDCVKIKKEYLSSITLVLQYTNPVVGMNFPYPMIELCNQKERRKCQAGHYNIQRVGEGQSIDYVLKWRKMRTDQSLSCSEFPEQ